MSAKRIKRGGMAMVSSEIGANKRRDVHQPKTMNCGYLEDGTGAGRPEPLKGCEKSEIIGESAEIKKILRTINAIGDSQCSILITGETGTGKEVVARALHEKRYGFGKPFVAVNCAAIPRELLEAELFGHEKGAFTGAVSKRIGKFEKACGGTLFLDEIGELDVSMQVKLLRVLQEREIERVGSSEKIKVDFRLLCATNGNLQAKIEDGSFREEFFYRINVLQIQLPPLRQRIIDIPLLVDHFLKYFCERERKTLSVSETALDIFSKYSWPGNVRELRNVMERAVVLAQDDRIEVKHLEKHLRWLKDDHPKVREIIPLKELEKQAISSALEVCDGNISKVARKLGISRKALYKRLKDCEIFVAQKDYPRNGSLLPFGRKDLVDGHGVTSFAH